MSAGERTGGRAAVAADQRDRGSTSLEFVVVIPGFLLVLVVLIYAGRLAIAHQAAEAAATDAARAASIARTQGAAQRSAQDSARTTLAQQGLRCLSTQVTLDTSAFTRPVGVAAAVTATVTCTVNLSDLAAPGIPGSKTVTATVTSPLDTYRQRT